DLITQEIEASIKQCLETTTFSNISTHSSTNVADCVESILNYLKSILSSLISQKVDDSTRSITDSFLSPTKHPTRIAIENSSLNAFEQNITDIIQNLLSADKNSNNNNNNSHDAFSPTINNNDEITNLNKIFRESNPHKEHRDTSITLSLHNSLYPETAQMKMIENHLMDLVKSLRDELRKLQSLQTNANLNIYTNQSTETDTTNNIHDLKYENSMPPVLYKISMIDSTTTTTTTITTTITTVASILKQEYSKHINQLYEIMIDNEPSTRADKDTLWSARLTSPDTKQNDASFFTAMNSKMTEVSTTTRSNTPYYDMINSRRIISTNNTIAQLVKFITEDPSILCKSISRQHLFNTSSNFNDFLKNNEQTVNRQQSFELSSLINYLQNITKYFQQRECKNNEKSMSSELVTITTIKQTKSTTISPFITTTEGHSVSSINFDNMYSIRQNLVQLKTLLDKYTDVWKTSSDNSRMITDTTITTTLNTISLPINNILNLLIKSQESTATTTTTTEQTENTVIAAKRFIDTLINPKQYDAYNRNLDVINDNTNNNIFSAQQFIRKSIDDDDKIGDKREHFKRNLYNNDKKLLLTRLLNLNQHKNR
ncbi:unnamed protein product, partial [Didymodactylos carnosus]